MERVVLCLRCTAFEQQMLPLLPCLRAQNDNHGAGGIAGAAILGNVVPAFAEDAPAAAAEPEMKVLARCR